MLSHPFKTDVHLSFYFFQSIDLFVISSRPLLFGCLFSNMFVIIISFAALIFFIWSQVLWCHVIFLPSFIDFIFNSSLNFVSFCVRSLLLLLITHIDFEFPACLSGHLVNSESLLLLFCFGELNKFGLRTDNWTC